MKTISLTQGKVALVDDEDYEHLAFADKEEAALHTTRPLRSFTVNLPV